MVMCLSWLKNKFGFPSRCIPDLTEGEFPKYDKKVTASFRKFVIFFLLDTYI